jgi:hypothetical protein
VNCEGFSNPEVKKAAINAFKHNEEVISTYLYSGLEEYRDCLSGTDDNKIIKDAADDSYRLFRKMGKMIGIVIPTPEQECGFRYQKTLSSFLCSLSFLPKKMITLDEFVELLYQHFGMIISSEQYKKRWL